MVKWLVALGAVVLAFTGLAPTAAFAQDTVGMPQGLGIVLVSPFSGNEASFTAFVLPVKLLPINAPADPTESTLAAAAFLASKVTLDILRPIDSNDLDLGISIQAQVADVGIPLRLGLNYTASGWGCHLRADLLGIGSDNTGNELTQQTLNSSVTSLMIGQDAVGVYYNKPLS